MAEFNHLLEWSPVKTHEQLEAEFEQILQKRAERLGKDREEVRRTLRPEARSIAAWRGAAEERGLGVADFLEMQIQQNTGSSYPTPLCLTASEVSADTLQDLGTEREQHVAECAGCSSLLAMLEKVPPLAKPAPDDPRYAVHEYIRAILRRSRRKTSTRGANRLKRVQGP